MVEIKSKNRTVACGGELISAGSLPSSPLGQETTLNLAGHVRIARNQICSAKM